MALCRLSLLTDIIFVLLKALLSFSYIGCHRFSCFYDLVETFSLKNVLSFPKVISTFRILSWHALAPSFSSIQSTTLLVLVDKTIQCMLILPSETTFFPEQSFSFYWVLSQVGVHSAKYLMRQHWRFLDSLSFFISHILPTGF